jgi:protein-disulfide isomerase
VKTTGALLALLPLLAAAAGCTGSVVSTGAMTADQLPTPSNVTADDSVAQGETKSGGESLSPFSVPGEITPVRQVIAKPTKAEIMQTGALPEMAFGRPNAPVTIIKYGSLTCPYCRRFQMETFPKLKKEYIDTGKVRFIIREFPIGKTSGVATIALRCAAPTKYLELYGKFLEQQPTWVSQDVRLDPIFKVASQVGMTRQQFDACRENQAMIAGLKWIKDRGRTLGVIGTPNFFVGDTLVKKVLTIEEIRAMVDPLLKGGVASATPG